MVLAQDLEPPLDTRDQLLPFERLAWENFERLCLRLALERGILDHTVDHAGGDHATGRMSAQQAQRQGRLYGTKGQDQQGIDLYVRLPVDSATGEAAGVPRYLSLQSRRIASLTAAGLKRAVNAFLKGKWAAVSDVFVYATSLSAVRTQLADEITRQTERLLACGVRFEVWDAEWLSNELKPATRHVLVDDFFGRAWVQRFYGPEAAQILGTRLDAGQVGEFREKLGGFYRALFRIADPGTAALQRPDAQRLELRDRFVLPDVLALAGGDELSAGWVLRSETDPQPPVQDLGPAEDVYSPVDAGSARSAYATARSHRGRPAGWLSGLGAASGSVSVAGAARVGADAWFTSGDRFMLVGGPGSGKSTFLRFAVLDLFSDEPSMPVWTERFGGRLPVWLPFHFLTRRRQKHDGGAASIEATLRAWLEQHDSGPLWPLLEKALADDRLLLVVDGLDEWVDEPVGRSAAMALEVYLAARNTPAVVSSRPYGLTRLGLSGPWSRADLAPLSPAQQRRLAQLWFRAAGQGDTAATAGSSQARLEQGVDAVEAAAVEAFIEEMQGLPELRSLAQVPLFLLLLVGLRLAGVQLPTRRFDVYERVVDQLLREHPARRAAAASAVADYTSMPQDDVRQVLAFVAYQHQSRGELGTVPESAVRRDVIAALQAPDHLAMDQQSAAGQARPFVEIAEGQLGVLVRQGPRELSFLHRVLLEQLAAEHAADHLTAAELGELFAARAGDPRWKDVLLAILWRFRQPQTVSELTAVLAEKAEDETAAALGVRELLAEVAFGSYRLPAPEAVRLARRTLDAIETHSFLPHRARLLSAAVPGIEHPAAGALLRERLARWTLARLPLSASDLSSLDGLPQDDPTDAVVLPVLLAALGEREPATAQAAAVAIAARYTAGERREQVRVSLVDAVRRSGTAQHAAMALAALVLGWHADEHVQRLVAVARRQRSGPMRIMGLIASRGLLPELLGAAEHDHRLQPDNAAQALTRDDLDWLAHQLDVEELHQRAWVSYTAAGLTAGAADVPARSADLRDRCLRIVDKESRERGNRAVAWAVLMRSYARDPSVIAFVHRSLAEDLSGLRFLGLGQMVHAYLGDPDIAKAIEDALSRRPDERVLMEQELHTLALIDQGPVMREALLASLAGRGFPHWAADALARHWGDDPVVMQALREVLDGAPETASTVSVVAVRVLGAQAAYARLLEMLRYIPATGIRPRYDMVVHALLEACRELGQTSGPEAEHVAQECLNVLDPNAMWEARTDAAVVAVLPRTAAARDRAEQMLAGPYPPMAVLLNAYGQDPALGAKALETINATARPLPAVLRLHLCGLLENLTPPNALVRDLTRGWPDETDDLVRSAACAAYHTHLLHARRRGTDETGEWDAALDLIRREAVKPAWENSGRRRSAWLAALVLDQIGILDGLYERDQQQESTVVLGDPITAPDERLLNAIATAWPQLRAHFGDRLLTRLSGHFLHSNGDDAWEFLAMVAERNPMLNRELSDAVAADPMLLQHEGVLAWYARTHHGQPDLPATLARHLHDGGQNLRSLAGLLLGRPEALGVTPEAVSDALGAELQFDSGFWAPYMSPAVEALADAAPGDDRVRRCWAAAVARREQGRLEMARRTYYPLAYAAVPVEAFIAQLHRDIDRNAELGGTFHEPQLAAAITRRLGRDAEARKLLQEDIRASDTTDATAAQLAALMVSAHNLDTKTARNLAERLQRQLAAETPDTVHDCLSGGDLPVPLLLLGVLSGIAGATDSTADALALKTTFA